MTSLLPSSRIIRLSKALSRAGVHSRRQAERLIEQKRVLVNDEVVDHPGVKVDPWHDRIVVDGRLIAPPDPTAVWCLHKPRKVLSARSDAYGRTTITDLLPGYLRGCMLVGRLDNDSEGLLLLTNDGQLKQRLERPPLALLPDGGNDVARSHARPPAPIPRVYFVTLRPVLPMRRWLAASQKGVVYQGVSYGPFGMELIDRRRGSMTLCLTLFEGKNREIRLITEALGGQVTRLIRTAYGNVRLGDLPCGAVRPLNQEELRELLILAGVLEDQDRDQNAALGGDPCA